MDSIFLKIWIFQCFRYYKYETTTSNTTEVEEKKNIFRQTYTRWLETGVRGGRG